MANVRFVNGDPTIGADLPETQLCPKGHPWGHSPDCPWLTIQFSVDQLAKIGGGTLNVATYQYDENVVMNGAKYSHISIVGTLHGAITRPVDAQFCEQRPLLAAKNALRPVVLIEGGANDMRLENLNLAQGAHGVAAEDVDGVNLIACCVHDNTAHRESGAGFLFEGCKNVLVQRCRVFANKAMDSGAMGGGGMMYECACITVADSYFHSNEAQLAGGALRVDKCKPHSKVAIDGNVFGDKDAARLAPGAVSALGNQADYGGAISIDQCHDVDIRIGMVKANKQFANRARYSGGALSLELSPCKIGQDNFLHNKAQQNGGAVYLHNGFDATFQGTHIQQNEAETGDGGGIYAAGEGYATSPSATFMTLSPGKLAVISADLHTNSATGGLGGGICAMFNVSARIEQTTFADKNAAGSGGGLYFAGDKQNRDLEIRNCTFEDNVADDFGGGCHIGSAVATVRNALFVRNTATQGGGLSVNGDKPVSGAVGLAVVPRRNNLTLERCGFDSNKAVDGGGAYIFDSVAGSVWENSVFANQGGFYFLTDEIRKLGVSHNQFGANKDSTGALKDIVSDGDGSTPAITVADLVAGNYVAAAGVVVK